MGVEPLFPGWKPEILTDRWTDHFLFLFRNTVQNKIVVRGVEPLFPGWKPEILTDRWTDRAFCIADAKYNYFFRRTIVETKKIIFFNMLQTAPELPVRCSLPLLHHPRDTSNSRFVRSLIFSLHRCQHQCADTKPPLSFKTDLNSSKLFTSVIWLSL
jgi:hypothetical protein